MALQVSKTNTEYKYIPFDQRGAEVDKPVTLTIRCLLPKESAALDDTLTRIYQDQSITINQGTYNYQIVRVALLNWVNICDEHDKPLALARVGSLCSDVSLNLLPSEWINEIANVISAITKNPKDAELYLGNMDADIK